MMNEINLSKEHINMATNISAADSDLKRINKFRVGDTVLANGTPMHSTIKFANIEVTIFQILKDGTYGVTKNSSNPYWFRESQLSTLHEAKTQSITSDNTPKFKIGDVVTANGVATNSKVSFRNVVVLIKDIAHISNGWTYRVWDGLLGKYFWFMEDQLFKFNKAPSTIIKNEAIDVTWSKELPKDHEKMHQEFYRKSTTIEVGDTVLANGFPKAAHNAPMPDDIQPFVNYAGQVVASHHTMKNWFRVRFESEQSDFGDYWFSADQLKKVPATLLYNVAKSTPEYLTQTVRDKNLIGYVLYTYMVFCPPCFDAFEDVVNADNIPNTELYTTDVGDYKQTCHECRIVLNEGNPDFPELYPVQKELTDEDFLIIRENIATTRNVLSNLKQEFDGQEDVSQSVKDRINVAFSSVQLAGESLGLWDKPAPPEKPEESTTLG